MEKLFEIHESNIKDLMEIIDLKNQTIELLMREIDRLNIEIINTEIRNK
jgi:hypothetical protein